MALFSRSDPDAARLGGELVALVRQRGTVPAGCLGLRLALDGLASVHLPGERVAATGSERLFFLHPGPWRVVLVPDPAAPEVGLEAVVELHFQAADNPSGLIAQLLREARPAPSHFSLQDLQECLQGTALQVPPCVQPHELERERHRLDTLWQNRFGLGCAALARVDRAAEVDTAALLLARLEAAQAAGSGEAAAGATGARTSSVGAGSVGAGGAGTSGDGSVALPGLQPAGVPSPRELAARQDEDDRLARRLYQELPRLSSRLRQALPLLDAATFAQWTRQVRACEDAARIAAHLPGLMPRIPTARTLLDPLQRSRELDRACEALDALWVASAEWPVEPAGDWAGAMDAVAAHVGRITLALERRRAL